MTNPIEEFIAFKTAAPNLGRIGRAVGSAAATGLGTAVAGAGIAAVGVAAGKLYDAVTKARDFKQMMNSTFNADLQQYHAERPKEFNEGYSSLRAIQPHFAKDPMIAGVYMRRMMQLRPDNAGGVLLEALSQETPASPTADAFHRGAVGGAQAGMTSFMKNEGDEEREAKKDERAVMHMGLQEHMRRQARKSEEELPPDYFRDIAVGKRTP